MNLYCLGKQCFPKTKLKMGEENMHTVLKKNWYLGRTLTYNQLRVYNKCSVWYKSSRIKVKSAMKYICISMMQGLDTRGTLRGCFPRKNPGKKVGEAKQRRGRGPRVGPILGKLWNMLHCRLVLNLSQGSWLFILTH